jgi:hypothetical protein
MGAVLWVLWAAMVIASQYPIRSPYRTQSAALPFGLAPKALHVLRVLVLCE